MAKAHRGKLPKNPGKGPKGKKPSRARAAADREPFIVFEAGPGKKPIGLIQKAARKRGGRPKLFIGVDDKPKKFEAVNLSAALKKKHGISRMPDNVQLFKDCAATMLGSARPGSLSVIFESYLLNNLNKKAECVPHANVTCQNIFLNFARPALRPGGRLVMVQDKSQLSQYRHSAKLMGMEFYWREIPDDVARKSPSKSIRMRSTAKRRLGVLRGYGTSRREVNRLISKGVINSREEFARPVIMSFKRPREEKQLAKAEKELAEIEEKVSEALLKLMESMQRMP